MVCFCLSNGGWWIVMESFIGHSSLLGLIVLVCCLPLCLSFCRLLSPTLYSLFFSDFVWHSCFTVDKKKSISVRPHPLDVVRLMEVTY
ncbi:hypothetical protein AQUCO_09100053v1 [Aquilegia coerulea]|uniref:Uncharacterized protein n=1 Tax=Aquilegia coerulea TaxID=218851 RepID=A0A2G5C5Q2_AQUCA|nr:hypothetical protein AQUCO_09100053v1 [Aquilegia coerulea]